MHGIYRWFLDYGSLMIYFLICLVGISGVIFITPAIYLNMPGLKFEIVTTIHERGIILLMIGFMLMSALALYLKMRLDISSRN